MSESEERVNRAMAGFLRQEIQSPANAVTEFLDMIIEDARVHKLDPMIDDLSRMHEAGIHLNTFVNGLIENSSAARHPGESAEAFHRRLRHDLRTPLNAIIGYSELLIEDTEASPSHPLRDDLKKVRESAGHLLKQIDAMAALTQRDNIEAGGDKSDAPQIDIIAGVLRSVRQDHAVQKRMPSSVILIVDDNALNRDVLSRRLIREGHHVVAAESGASALELVEKDDFDLILLDLIMPETNGYEVLCRLKASERTSHVPVVVISALHELDSIVRCIEAGAEDYLTKPFDPTLLRARINASLERKLLRDRENRFLADLTQEKRRSEALLLNILPQSIVQRMRGGETAIADRIEDATILFCDLVGFTALSQKLSADLVINFLGKIFSAFDRLAAEQGVEKIKTIGDSYMAASGIPEPQSDHAFRVAALSLQMLQAVEDVAKDTKLDLQARIGIHSGPVVAGVIGTHKFVYDVWGDTVNTASRMESHSLAGRIQVSAVTRNALGNRFRFEPRGTIEIKGKMPMETFFLNQK